MSNKIVITKAAVGGRDYLASALLEEGRLAEAAFEDVLESPLLGNVYIGKVKGIIEKIEAVFVEIAPKQTAYLPLKEAEYALFSRQCRPGRLTEGDEIVVQVAREAVKTKGPVVSTGLDFKGSALVLTTRNRILGVSKKLGDFERQRLKSLFAEKMSGDFGLIIRTNAANYADEHLFAEFQAIYDRFRSVTDYYMHRTCYSCLYRESPSYVSMVRDCLALPLEKIVTDEREVYEELEGAFLKNGTLANEQLVFYEDPALSLSALYGLRSKLDEALKERVRLKSGAYLVIQPTEALTVIDVNSGKCIKGNRSDFYLKINLEAAREVARQLRLRNISGICIVDFINMDTKEAEAELAAELRKCLARDAVPAAFEGFTKLGLAEITRKKVKKPLREQVSRGRRMDEESG